MKAKHIISPEDLLSEIKRTLPAKQAKTLQDTIDTLHQEDVHGKELSHALIYATGGLTTLKLTSLSGEQIVKGANHMELTTAAAKKAIEIFGSAASRELLLKGLSLCFMGT